MASGIERLDQLSDSQISNLNKGDVCSLLKGVLRDIANDTRNNSGKLDTMSADIQSKLDTISSDILSVRNEVQNVRTELNVVESRVTTLESTVDPIRCLPDKMDELENTIENLYKSIEYQQRFAEGLDARLRSRNLIFLGVAENRDDIGESDLERVRKIIEKTGYTGISSLGDITIKRLGIVQDNPSRARPIHVTVASSDIQWDILTKASALKQIDGYKEIFIKKDTHPTIRKEFGRLYKREQEERNKPTNSGVEIKYDRRRRVLLRDDEVIDRYSPSF